MSFDDYDLRLGDIMRGERATMGKSLLDVQRELKIKATYIAAIEDCDVSQFESQGFVAGYVRSYARYLGIDPEWTFARFCDEARFCVTDGLSASASQKQVATGPVRADTPDPLANPTINFVPPRDSLLSRIEPAAVGSVTVLVALIAAVGYGGWTVLHEIQRVHVAPTDRSPDVTAQLDPLPDAHSLAMDAADTELAMPGADAFDRLYRPQALETPVMTARDGPIATINPHAVAERPDDAPQADGAATTLAHAPQAGPDGDSSETGAMSIAEAVADSVARSLSGAQGDAGGRDVQVVAEPEPEVRILAARPAWMRVTAADGTILMERTLNDGETYAVPRNEEPARLRVGNSGAVYFVVAGETYGPVAAGAQVVDSVALSPEAITGRLDVADLDSDPDLRDAVAVAGLRDD